MLIILKYMYMYWVFDNYRIFFNIYFERYIVVKLNCGFYVLIFDYFIKKGKLNFNKILCIDCDKRLVLIFV